MNVLILGSGAREHALAAAVVGSPMIDRLFVAPGNPGCEAVAHVAPLDLGDHAAIIQFCIEQKIGFVIVGPEAPLVAGIVDDLAAAGVAAFGPTRAAARLEGSKGFTKDFCREFGIPTAEYRRFYDRTTAIDYVAARGAPIVVKADGLAAGKGVVVAETLDEARDAVAALYDKQTNAECVIEERLEGEEVSFFALSDGEVAIPFGDAQDHKRAGDGDTGPNTGGMGAYSPSPLVTDALSQTIMSRIVTPTIDGMRRRGSPFRGILFAGLIITEMGPKLIEFNVRFGDPEAEVVLPRFRGDLLRWLWEASVRSLPAERPPFSSQHALAVVMAAKGYPGTPQRGEEIRGIERAAGRDGAAVFHGGTRRVERSIFADGGRVLVVAGMASTLSMARDRAYSAVNLIEWSSGFYRRDIGARALVSPK